MSWKAKTSPGLWRIAYDGTFPARHQVLRISPGTADGRNVFVVTVMNPPGDFNEAFQVNTLVVDAETGRLVPQFRHLPSGQSFSGAARNVPNRQSPDASRGRTWR